MSKKTSTSSKPWNPQAVNGAQDTLNSTVAANAPQLAQNASTINSQLPGLASRAFAPDPTVTAAQGYDQNVLNGQYLGAGNPYMNGMIDQTNRGVTDQVNSQFGLGGRTGSDQHAQVLSRSLADADNNLRYGNYSNERGYMNAAALGAPGLNAGQYAGISPLLGAAQTGSTIPYLGADALANGTANLQGRFGTTTQTQPFMSTLGNIAGLGMMAFGAGGPLGGIFGGGGK